MRGPQLTNEGSAVFNLQQLLGSTTKKEKEHLDLDLDLSLTLLTITRILGPGPFGLRSR